MREIIKILRRDGNLFYGAVILPVEGKTVIVLDSVKVDTVTVPPVAVELGLKTAILLGKFVANVTPGGAVCATPSVVIVPPSLL